LGAQLYVGAQIGRAGKRHLRRLGVGASVNLRAEFDDVASGLALPDHLHLPTVHGQPPTLAQLRAGVEFIGRVVRGGGCVYVHCDLGVGRAPLLAAAYLVSTGCALVEAQERGQRVRPFVEFTAAQTEQLPRFAEWWGEGAPNQPLQPTAASEAASRG
jgi:protein-tyrosine phosphatase